MRKRYPSDLSNTQWEVLQSLIPPAKPGGRPRQVDMREVLNTLFYKARTGCQWDYLPHTNMDKFFYGLENAVEAGYKLHCQDINCFVLFGLPDEDLQAVYDTLVFASSRVGSVIPMLFTPVPSTPMFEMYRDYIEEKGFDFQHLNGKLLPFLDYNRRKYKELSVHDYYALEGLMWRLNAKVRAASFNLGGSGRVSQTFRKMFMGYDPPKELQSEEDQMFIQR